MLKAKDLRNEGREELISKLKSLREELYENSSTFEKKSEKPHIKGQKRKEIARILTVLREEELKK